jgi:hypothetical protein
MNVAQIILGGALNWCDLDKNVSDARKVFVMYLYYFLNYFLNIILF